MDEAGRASRDAGLTGSQMQQLPPKLGDAGHGLRPPQEGRMKRERHGFSRLGLSPMSVHTAAQCSFPVLQLIVVVLCAAGTMSSQAPPEPSALSLQQAVTIAMEKNPLRKAALAETKAASAGIQEARSF